MAQYTLNFTIVDAKAQSSRHMFYVNEQETMDIATLIEYCQAYAAALDPNITGAINRITFSLDVPLPGGIKSAALPGSDVEEGRKFFYRANSGFIFNHRVPTFDEDVIPEVQITDFDNLPQSTKDFVNLIISPLEAPEEWPVDPCDNRGSSLTAFRRSTEDFKKSRK